MQRLALLAALLIPTLAQAFEVGDKLVCIRSCPIKDGGKTRDTMLPGDSLTVGAKKDALVQDTEFGSGWVRADCLILADQAEKHFQARLRRDPNDVEARCGLAFQLLDHDKKDAALTEAREAVRRRENWITLQRLACVQRILNQRAEASQSLDRAIELQPQRLYLRLCRGRTLLKVNPRDAIDDLSYVLERDALCMSALEFRAAAWQDLGELEHSLADFSAVLELNPTEVKFLVGRALVFSASGELDLALEDANGAIRLEPRCAEAHRVCAACLMKKVDLKSALQAFNTALDIEPDHANAHFGRAICLLAMRAQEAALKDLDEAIRLDPKNVQYSSVRGNIWSEIGDEDRAIADFTEAIRLQPKNPQLYDTRAASCSYSCRYAQAVDDFTTALDLN